MSGTHTEPCIDHAENIRARYASRSIPRDLTNGVKALAREYGVDCNVIYQITSGRTYFA